MVDWRVRFENDAFLGVSSYVLATVDVVRVPMLVPPPAVFFLCASMLRGKVLRFLLLSFSGGRSRPGREEAGGGGGGGHGMC